MMTLIQMLLFALIPTILIELAVLLLLREQRGRVLGTLVVVNVMTNIPLNLYVIFVSGSGLTMLLGEAVVVLVEALCYFLLLRDVTVAFVYSLLCNAISFLTGLLVQLSYVFIQGYIP